MFSKGGPRGACQIPGHAAFRGRRRALWGAASCICGLRSLRLQTSLPRSAQRRGWKMDEHPRKLDGKWWTLRNNDNKHKKWWTLRRATDYTPSQFKLSEVMLWDLAALVSILATASFAPVDGGFARDAAESWLLAPQQNDSGHQAEEKTNGPCCFWAHKALRYLAHLRPKPWPKPTRTHSVVVDKTWP